MNYNDKQQNQYHLLIWLNAQRDPSLDLSPFSSLQQLKHSKLLPSIMSKLNYEIFAELLQQEYCHQNYFVKILKYMQEVEGVKFKRREKERIQEREFLGDLVGIVLFLVMKAEGKQEYVDRILDLGEETQVYLMNMLKNVQENVENSMEIKDIFDKISQFEDQNETLTQQLLQLQSKNARMRGQKESFQLSNEQLSSLNHKSFLEKAQIMQKLGIGQMKSYLQMFRDLQNERVTLIHSQNEVQAENGRMMEENTEMEEKVEEDKAIVEHLGMEIRKYKQVLQELKKSNTQIRGSFKENKENVLLDEDGQQLIPNVRMTKSITHDTTHGSISNNLPNFQEEDPSSSYYDIPLTTSIKTYGETLTDKLQTMHTRISQLNGQISSLKQQKVKFMKKNRKTQKIIERAERQFRGFGISYQFTISG